jgi:hypothetical protein
MTEITLQLTDEEASYLSIEMNMLLCNYGTKFVNPHMGSAFNKVFKALAGEDHQNYLKQNESEGAE